MDAKDIDYTKTVTQTQPDALGKLKDALRENKWGVVSDIDMRATLKEKIGADVESYNILDVCNPGLANQALKLNKKAGLVMPCKLVVYSEAGSTVVSLYLPTRMFPREIGKYQELQKLAEEAETSLKKVVDAIASTVPV